MSPKILFKSRVRGVLLASLLTMPFLWSCNTGTKKAAQKYVDGGSGGSAGVRDIDFNNDGGGIFAIGALRLQVLNPQDASDVWGGAETGSGDCLAIGYNFDGTFEGVYVAVDGPDGNVVKYDDSLSELVEGGAVLASSTTFGFIGGIATRSTATGVEVYILEIAGGNLLFRRFSADLSAFTVLTVAPAAAITSIKGIYVATNGTVYVAGSDHVEAWTPHSTLADTYESSIFVAASVGRSCDDVCVGPDGQVYVVDRLSRRIRVYDSAGQAINAEFVTEENRVLNNMLSISVTEASTVFLVNGEAHPDFEESGWSLYDYVRQP
jgi:hypothetical protein